MVYNGLNINIYTCLNNKGGNTSECNMAAAFKKIAVANFYFGKLSNLEQS